MKNTDDQITSAADVNAVSISSYHPDDVARVVDYVEGLDSEVLHLEMTVDYLRDGEKLLKAEIERLKKRPPIVGKV